MEVREPSAKYLTRSRYKQTEVGVIPDDWKVKSLGNIFTFGGGLSASRAQLGDSGHCYLHYGDIHTSSKVYVDIDAQNVDLPKLDVRLGDVPSKSLLLDGDVVFVDASEDDDGASKHQVIRNPRNIPFISGLHTIVAKNKSDDLVNDYKCHCFHTRSIKKQFLFYSVGTKVTGISKTNIGKILLPIPPVAEQAAIAEALSDADALIESLEQFLAKKRQLKQGAMQKLLTGKRRLPGFSGEWKVRRLDELGRWTGGMTPSMRNPDYWQAGTVPWISSGDVKSVRLHSTAFSVSEYAVKQKATILLPENSITVVTRSGILRKYLPVAMNMVPMAINQDIKALLPNRQVLPEFVLHSLSSNGNRILARCLKSGTTVESIEFPWLKAFTIPMPQLPEQTAIAAILSDMDAEIAALEAKLSKTRELKQGMMQELLTGRIRLV